MESTVRAGNFLLTIRATGSTCQNLTHMAEGWINADDAVDYCTIFPMHTVHKDFEGVRRIVRTDTGEVIRELIPNHPVRALDNTHIIDTTGNVTNMETLETCTRDEWAARQPTPLMQVAFFRQSYDSATLTVTSHGGSTSNLPLLRLANCTGNVFYNTIDNFLVVGNYANPTVITPVVRGNLVLELKEVIGNFHIFQTRGLGLHTKPAARRYDDDE